jgi:hypothetical protein
MPVFSQAVPPRRAAFAAAIAVAAGLLISTPFQAHHQKLERQESARSVAATTAHREATERRPEQIAWLAEHVKYVEREAAHTEAEAVLARAQEVKPALDTKVDTAPLASSVEPLTALASLSTRQIITATEKAKTELSAAEAAGAEVDRIAAEKAAAEEALRRAEAARLQAEAAAAAEVLRLANTPEGAKAAARELAASTYGWGDGQFSCLASLWTKESGWRFDAYNASGGATGIPQSLPGSKMAAAGADWQTSARTQIIWGLGYIKSTYGTPCAAWGHSQARNWY